jgi:hypothetical protein
LIEFRQLNLFGNIALRSVMEKVENESDFRFVCVLPHTEMSPLGQQRFGIGLLFRRETSSESNPWEELFKTWQGWLAEQAKRGAVPTNPTSGGIVLGGG